MQDDIRIDRFWSRLVWPILWPVMLAQAVLVLLCLVVGVMLWWMMPSHASWGATFWLLLALLLGTSLNVAVFLMLLRQRLRGVERDVNDAMSGVEAYLARNHRPPRHDLPFSQRLRALTSACEGLVEGWHGDLRQHHASERRLADELQVCQGELERCEASRVRAREESRLKSGYLCHLRRSLAPLLASLTELLESETLAQRGGKRGHAALKARLADAMLLLENLGDATETPTPPSLPGTFRVLIVDDGPVNLTLARQVLERQGFQVATATSGEQALSLLEDDAFDLVLMDIFMPGMDGVETSRQWREREATMVPRRRSILVALTANASDEDRFRFRQAGMDDFLAKPYRPQALVDTVRQWLPSLPEADPA
ncbi:hypothetical protein BOX17_03395 [Halomonas aestuarii]|uniref:Response regulatory domain-containing protein n=1 Tax=Halomonas aestuarii TaxID=1897729 RepID=A0A1J0VDH5_9GAMM|nr:response regulator [Halomonas aestuarii]APE30081.1 hypothetical protein BOX17_03395 [Halomonas aestuarii]